MFSMKKYFSAENVFIFQIFLRVTLFFISIVVFFCLFICLVFFEGGGGVGWGRGGETQHAYDFPKLNLILYLENMLKFLGPFKKYVRSDGGGRGGTPKICENV